MDNCVTIPPQPMRDAYLGFENNVPPTVTHTGVCLARILFSFLVVCNHFFTDGIGAFWIIPLRQLAVPVFFILAFFFMERKHRSSGAGNGLQGFKRLRRILLPFWVWGLVFAPMYLFGYLYRNPSAHSFWTSLRRIALQLSFGHVYDAPLWFLFALAFWTAVWLLLKRSGIPDSVELPVLLLLFATGILLQYSGWNASLFERANWFVRFPLGRLAECLPFAIAGIFLARTGIADRLKKSRMSGLHLLWIAPLCWPFSILSNEPPAGFGYQGLFLVRSGVFLVLFFLLLPLEALPIGIQKRIQSVSKLSLGVYCVHVPIGSAIVKTLAYATIRLDPFFRCLVIYIICWIFCFLFARLVPPTRTIVQ